MGEQWKVGRLISSLVLHRFCVIMNVGRDDIVFFYLFV